MNVVLTVSKFLLSSHTLVLMQQCEYILSSIMWRDRFAKSFSVLTISFYCAQKADFKYISERNRIGSDERRYNALSNEQVYEILNHFDAI